MPSVRNRPAHPLSPVYPHRPLHVPEPRNSLCLEILQSVRTERAPRPGLNTPPRSVSAQQRQAGLDIARNTVREVARAREQREREQQLKDMTRGYTRRELEQQQTRRWRPGDVYAPHDLSGVEMAKWKRVRRQPKARADVLDQLGMNPLQHYKNFSIMSEYMTDMGRIRHNTDTGLRPVNQRRMAKAVRRAIGLGLMPSVYRHPEILRGEMLRNRQLLA